MIAKIRRKPDRLLSTFVRERYIPHHELAKGSQAQLRTTVRKFERYLTRPAVLDDLNRETIVAFLNWYLNEVEPTTVAAKRRGLLAVWRFAYDENLVTVLPHRIKTIKVPRKVPEGDDEQELSLLLAACERMPGTLANGVPRSLFFRAFVLAYLSHGLRFSAGMQLRLADVRHDRTFTVRWRSQKTWVEQAKQLRPDAWAAIQACHAYGKFDGLLPWPYAEKRLWKWWRRLRTLAGLPMGRRYGPQHLRRTAASFKERQQPGSAKEFLGHQTDGLAAKSYLVPRIVRPEMVSPPVFNLA